MSQNILAEPGSNRFGRFLFAAFMLELLALLALIYTPEPPPARVVKPAVVAVHLIHPAPPKPKPAPLPPPPPVPALPKPPPPLPHHPHVAPKPPPRLIHHPILRPHPPPPPRPSAPSTQPAPPAPVISAPPPSPAIVQSVEARYVGTIKGIILGNLVVPTAMRNLGASGVATIAFKVAPTGQILSAKVLRASDYAAANRAALAAVRDSRFPAFFAKMPAHPIIFELNINVSGAQ